MIYRFFHNDLLWHMLSVSILPYFPSFGKGVSEDFHRKFHDRFLLEFRSFFRPQPIVDSRVVANSGPVWYTEVEIPPIPPMEGERDMTLGQRISCIEKS